MEPTVNSGLVKIGTSNVVMPGNKQTFPPEFQTKTRLHYYSTLLNSVEINSSFYKIPLPTTCAKWSQEVSDGFQFSLKLLKHITHEKELKGDKQFLEQFLKAAECIGPKKGCLLIQFPGKITLEYFAQVESILETFSSLETGSKWKKAIEFRNNSWYAGEAYELLDHYGAALVLHDIPKSKKMSLHTKANHIYIRLHGPTGNYRDSYSEKFLIDLSRDISTWKAQGKEVFVYFNNTIGSAFDNAVFLQRLLANAESQ